jgi:hypothetical protein
VRYQQEEEEEWQWLVRMERPSVLFSYDPHEHRACCRGNVEPTSHTVSRVVLQIKESTSQYLWDHPNIAQTSADK